MGWLGAGALSAQQAELTGIVQDASRAPVRDAKVTIQNLATNLSRNTASNAAGVYHLPSLPPGLYRLSVEAQGFERTIVDQIKLEVGAKLTRDLALTVGSLSQTVTVSGNSINVNTTDGSVSTVVDRQFIENIPLSGRTFQSLLNMVPGTATVATGSYANDAGNITVNGQRAEANYFTVDGVSANTGSTPYRAVGAGVGFSGSGPGNTALGTTQSLVSIDALQEFRAYTSTYSAEQGRTPGGQFAFTTRGGTNEYHGSLFEYFRNDKLDANNWFNNANRLAKPTTRQNNFGATLGGPITIPKLYNGKDRTFFFYSYEGLRLRTPQTAVNRAVPSMELRRNAPAGLEGFLNSFPIPNGADWGNGLALYNGTYSNPATLDTHSLRVDHSFNDRFKVFGRYSDSPSESGARSAARVSQITNTIANTKTVTLGSTNILSPRFSNEARYNYTLNSRALAYRLDNYDGSTPWDLTQIPGVGTTGWLWSGYIYGGGDQRTTMTPQVIGQQQQNLTNTFTATLGRHNLKLGIDYRRLTTPLDLPEFQITLYMTSEQQIRTNRSDIQVSRYTGPFRPVYQNFSAFVQDEWKLNNRLNLSLGLRWDVNPAPSDALGKDPYTVDQISNLSTTKLAPQGTQLWKTQYANFAPRAGVAYRLRETPGWETILRGGFGLFYDMGNNQGSVGYGGVGLSTSTYFNGASFPLTRAQLDTVPQPSIATPYAAGVYGGVSAYDPNLKLPYSLQWNLAIEQKLSDLQSLTVSYVGSAGRRMLVNRTYRPAALGNPNFASTGSLNITRNGATSDYAALQMQYQRRLSKGFQAQAAYTWSHAIDEASSNFELTRLLRGDADFDIRHNLQIAFTYDVPGTYSNPVLSALLQRWALDSRISARTATPINISNTTGFDMANGINQEYQPNLVPGQPIYLYGSSYPGGKRINRAAFATTPLGVQGDLGRNVVRGFGSAQADLAVRREFRLTERFNLQFRAEAFNLLNRPNFGAINSSLTSNAAIFGLATGTLNSQLSGLNSLYQMGGPRSMQLALKLRF
ncbi:TonB-dependent receptor [Bryobacter aggregatus]|uniref:TonB-dependent receptor n=1 Tax=Bryobacter aggregatus TaxID=360054 RepID=UPI0004E28254|nr:TonB-dependent receptor [Bryobacter aggregatus]